MTSPSRNFLETILDLAWSHWTGLGVSGVFSPPETAIDPEALILFTATLANEDPRLWDEVHDWCISFGSRFVSWQRLKVLRGSYDTVAGIRVDELAAVVNHLGGTHWHTAEQPRSYRPSGKSRLPRLELPAHALLAFRCVFGVSARADILHELATAPVGETRTVASFTELGYGKRNLANVLSDLALANLVNVVTVGNAHHYSLRDRAALRKLLVQVPGRSGMWHHRLPILAAFVPIACSDKQPMSKALEARSLLRQHGPSFTRLALEPPRPVIPAAYWDELAPWLIEHVATLRETGHADVAKPNSTK